MHRKILFSFLALATSSSLTSGTETTSHTMQEHMLLGQPDEPQPETDFAYNGKSVFEQESWPDEQTVFNHLVDNLDDEEFLHPELRSSQG